MFYEHVKIYVLIRRTKWTKICAGRTKTNLKDRAEGYTPLSGKKR